MDEYMVRVIDEVNKEIAAGKTLVAYTQIMGMPTLEDVGGKRISYEAYTTPWGGEFRRASNPTLNIMAYELIEGKLPEEFRWPAPRCVTASVGAYQTILTDIKTSEQIVIDFGANQKPEYRIKESLDGVIRQAQLNYVIVECKVEHDDVQVLKLATDHVVLNVAAALYDESDRQLVAALLCGSSQQELTALRATLCSNSHRSICVAGVYLTSAGHGYINVGAPFSGGADGFAMVLLHALCKSPQEYASEDHFFVVVTGDEDMASVFCERLNLAVPWPAQPEWADALLSEGRKAGLVEDLILKGTPVFQGIRVLKDADRWKDVIMVALENNQITL